MLIVFSVFYKINFKHEIIIPPSNRELKYYSAHNERSFQFSQIHILCPQYKITLIKKITQIGD